MGNTLTAWEGYESSRLEAAQALCSMWVYMGTPGVLKRRKRNNQMVDGAFYYDYFIQVGSWYCAIKFDMSNERFRAFHF